MAHYVGLLEARFGHLAIFCADYYGGALLGVKWRPAAFLPRPRRAAAAAATAHTALECRLSAGGASEGHGKGEGQGKPPRGLPVVPDVIGVLADMRRMGEGLVDDVVPC